MFSSPHPMRECAAPSAGVGRNGLVTFDIAATGFGPSSLSLAVALHDFNSRSRHPDRLRFVFFERQETFGWHRGMLIDGARMQVSFLKDLVTQENPSSPFTYLNYLKAKGRLNTFINQKSFFPTRLEYHDYLEWAARFFADHVRYGSNVTAIRGVGADGDIDQLVISTCRDGREVESARARNVVIATGLEPKLPVGITASARIHHSSNLRELVARLTGTNPSRLAVVGAGQSGAEAVDYLHRVFVDAEICAVISRFGYSAADDTPFANSIFDPEAVDRFYDAPEPVKESILKYHANTNYSVVDPDLLAELSRRVYQEQVQGRARLRLHNVSRLVECEERQDGVGLVIEEMCTGRRTRLEVDHLILATGYRPVDPARILGDLQGLCRRDNRGRLVVGRDYRIRTDPRVKAGIYLMGNVEHSHGISSSLLSNLAARSSDIVRSIIDRSAARLHTSQEWCDVHAVL
jgi:L-ornithine N5-oxygenase